MATSRRLRTGEQGLQVQQAMWRWTLRRPPRRWGVQPLAHSHRVRKQRELRAYTGLVCVYVCVCVSELGAASFCCVRVS